MIRTNLMGVGMSAGQAEQVAGSFAGSLTAAGSSSQANALLVSADVNHVTTTAANTGVRLPTTMNAGDHIVVSNYGASTLSVYPPTGGKIQNGSTNAAFSVAANKVAMFIALSATDFAAILTA